MKDKDKPKEQPIDQSVQLRQRITELEALGAERKLAEQELQKSEREKALILSTLSELVTYQDNELRIKWANRAAGESVGLPTDQLVGHHCYEIWQKRMEPCIGCPVLQVLKTGECREGEMTTPDGRVWSIRGYPVRDEDDDLIGAVEVTMEITKQKRAEEAVKKSEQRYRELYENLPDGSAVVDMTGRIIEFNFAFQKMLGYAAEEIYKFTYKDITPKKWHRIEEKILREQVLERDYSDIYEKEYIRKDGTIFPVELRTYLIRDENGSPAGMWAFVRDVTQRKQMERKIEDNAITLALDLSEQFEVLQRMNKGDFSQPAPEDSRNELVAKLGRLINQILHRLRTANKEIEDNAITLALDLSEQFEVLQRMNKGDFSQPAPEDSKDQLVAKLGGLINQILCRFQQTTELLTSIMDSATEYVIVAADDKGTILNWNKGAENLLEYEAEEVLNRESINIFYTKESPNSEAVEANINQMIQNKKPYYREIQYVKKSGKAFPVSEIVMPRFDHQGDFVGILTIARDITDRKRVEQELKLQTQKALEASRLKSEFLANMSHEIRTPLNAIMGFAQLLEDDPENPLTDTQREFLRYILSGGESLLAIINDILDLSKIEAGKITLENIECSLKEIISELYKMFKQRADEKGIDLRISYGEDISDKILSDPTRLRQILLNLTGNAIKFTDKGYVEIGVQKGNNYPDYFEFYVRDTGIGIPQEKVQSIFKPFEQADGSMTRKYGGTGLGLTVANRLISLMGGEINVISELGKGSTFYFHIPYKPVEGTSEKLLKTEITDGPHVSGEVRRCILVAEDNDPNYRLIEALLTKNGFDTVRAENGEDAISIYKTKRDEIDLILMDVHMPVLGGLEATRVIREQYNDGIPIIALTAYAMKGDLERFLKAGCTDYVSKPLTSSELLEKIEQCVGLR
jgi:PAS domain S-box-containing protein